MGPRGLDLEPVRAEGDESSSDEDKDDSIDEDEDTSGCTCDLGYRAAEEVAAFREVAWREVGGGISQGAGGARAAPDGVMTPLDSLAVVPGKSYVAEHAGGGCRHCFMVVDVRALSPLDPQWECQYPFMKVRCRQPAASSTPTRQCEAGR